MIQLTPPELQGTDSFYFQTGKRLFDFACASVGLIALSPLLAIVGLAVKLTSHGPVLFTQFRVGQFGKPFRILKFRTMRHQAGETASLLTASGDSRITPIGKLLRKTKIDELPQLINVLLGDMSLVGPRPEVPRYVAAYTERQRTILALKPGITGLSTHQFRNEEELLAQQQNKEEFYMTTVLPAKLDIDLAYCGRITFWRDLRVIFATLAGLSGIMPAHSQQEI